MFTKLTTALSKRMQFFIASKLIQQTIYFHTVNPFVIEHE